VLADVQAFGGGMDVAQRLARANMVTNKNLLPRDTAQDWDRPSGLRLGTIEVTRLGMHEPEMAMIAEFMARVLVEQEPPDTVVEDVIAFRQGYQTLYYNFDHALPPR
jgi:glycine hydroxymethyltransferase